MSTTQPSGNGTVLMDGVTKVTKGNTSLPQYLEIDSKAQLARAIRPMADELDVEASFLMPLDGPALARALEPTTRHMRIPLSVDPRRSVLRDLTRRGQQLMAR